MKDTSKLIHKKKRKVTGTSLILYRLSGVEARQSYGVVLNYYSKQP